MTARSTFANVAWMSVNAYGYRQFHKALRNLRDTQTSILSGYLQANKLTAFGRRWSFATVQSAEQYRDQVPLSTYEDYSDDIKRIAAGESDVLTQQRVRLFELSSGSTQPAKWIPFTSGLQAEVRRAVAPWVFDLARQHPTLLRGRSYWSVSPALRVDNVENCRIPVGFDSDSAYLGGLFKPLVNATLAVPAQMAHLDDLDMFRRATLLHLLRTKDLRLVSVWHPSFWLLLMTFLEEHWDALMSDLHQGIDWPEAAIHIPADPDRARQLTRSQRPTAAAIWPSLKIISCWSDGQAQSAAADLAQKFPKCIVQPKGLIATEGFVSLPFAGHRPLAVTAHFFEFLDARGVTHFAWELKQGEQYSVVMTTAGGLYRYQLQDVVEVTGFLEQTPCLRFLHKEDHVSDLRGEKLNEGFVASVVQELLASTHATTHFALLAPRCSGGQSQYVLYLEAEAPRTLDLDRMAADLDIGLRRNPHYEYCLGLDQLRPAVVALTEPHAFERYAERLRRNGQRLGNIKPMMLSRLADWDPWLCGSASYSGNVSNRIA